MGPLACIALVATGKWKAKYQGEEISGKEALKKTRIQPMKLSYKEGLSLINGTSEINSSNDNPLILADYEDFFHNGHFHGQYISMAMDHLGINLTTLSNLADSSLDERMTGVLETIAVLIKSGHLLNAVEKEMGEIQF